ncbi:uncharacterized protein LOC144125168 isoform X5 [Amblyomma americanum]
MEEERLKKLRAGQEMFAEKRKRLKRRSAQQQHRAASAGGDSGVPGSSALCLTPGAGPGPQSPPPSLADEERGSRDNSFASCTSPSSVPLPSSSQSSSLGSRLSADTSHSSMASAASSDRVSRKTSTGNLSGKVNNGLDSSSNISFSSIEACASPELLKKESERSPAHGDTSFNETLSRYKKKMGEVKRQLSKRDELIRLLTERLEETRQEQERAQQEASQQEHTMAQEVSQLKRELQLCMELLEARGGDAALKQQHQLMLSAKNEVLEQLQQKVEAQEQQITMLQQIRTDLLGRLAAASLGPEQGEIVANNAGHLNLLSSNECKAAGPSDVGCHGDAVTLTLMPLSELSDQPLVNDSGHEHLSSQEHPESDDCLLPSCKQLICSHLSDWITARSLSVDSYADIVSVFDDLKLFAMQGLHYAAACEPYNIPVPNPADLLREVAALHTKVAALEEELRTLEAEMISVRTENGNLRRSSVATEEELRTLRTERNLTLSSIKESEYQRAKEEVEDESLLEVYELQTECIRLEQEKKALEQQRTRLMSGEQSPCVSPIPSVFTAVPERVRHSSAVQTDDVEAAKSALENSCAAFAQAVDKRLSLDSLNASTELDDGENEKGAYDALVAENIRLTADRQRAESDLEVTRERLRSAEDLIDKLKAQLDQEHGTLEQLVAKTEEMLQATTNADLSSRDRRIFLENQSLKCQVVLLNSRLEWEQDFSSALKRHVQCLGSRDEAFQKTVKDLTNRLLSGGERLRSSMDRCRQLEQALAKSAAKAKRLEAELQRLRGSLKASGDASPSSLKNGDAECSALQDEESKQQDRVDTEASNGGSGKGSNGDRSIKEEGKPLVIQRMLLELEEKELLLSNQDLCSRSSQQLELCRQREQLHAEYGERFAAALTALKDSCRRDLLSFQECLVRESSLQLLRLRESHQADIAALKQRHAEQVEQLRAKLLPTEAAQSSASEEEEAVLAELRQRQQAEYEQLLPRLDADLQLKLQALVALTLRIHQVENERALASAQERLANEKQRLWEALTACNQVHREALEARLEHEQKAALRDQYQALLNDTAGQMHSSEDATAPPSPATSAAAAAAPAPATTATTTTAAGDGPDALHLSQISRDHAQSTVEVLCGLLKERLDKDFHAAVNQLTGEWKEKYANASGSAASEDPSGAPREGAEALLHDLKKHLESAKEAEQLVLSFHRLGDELKTGLQSKLELLLDTYRELCDKMDAASALERYRGLCEQLCSGAPADPASLQHQQNLQLKALRASLEEQHSQEKTALLSEQVVRTKELLSKHRAELEQLERAAEARLADERRRLTEELDVLRRSLWEKEQALSRAADEREAKASAEMAALIDKHGTEVQRLSSALKEEQRKAESLHNMLDSLKRERDEIVELAEGIAEAGASRAADPSTIIRRLAEENATLRQEAVSAKAEHESELAEEEARFQEAEAEHRKDIEELLANQEQYQEELKLKDEELLLLKHQVEQYADSLGSLRLEYDQELESVERRLEAKHTAEVEALKSEHRANIDVLRESLHQELQDVKAGYDEQQQKLHRSLEMERNLVANSQKAQYELALEALRKNHGMQLEKLKEHHASAVEELEREKAQLEQRMEEERASAMRDLKRKLEAHYTEIVETAKVECASRVKQLQEELGRLKTEVSSLRQQQANQQPVEEEELVPAKASQSEAAVYANSASLDSLDGKHPDQKEDGEETVCEGSEMNQQATDTAAENSARDGSVEWSDISVEDILYERSELLKQLRSLSATVDRLQVEKEDMQEQLRKAHEELASKEIRATSRSPREWLAGSGLTANEIQSWQLHTAQTNTRLLNVLSDLVKTYVDTEQEIQDALGQLGLSRVDSPASNTAADEDYSSLGGMSCQTQGSKEDFGDGFLSELCEDGPDLTPRTWDMFASAIGMQDTTEMEGEDVVLGASRRLRTAVDRVLRLLAEVSEHRGEDFRGLVQRNRDLCHELRQESQLHNQLSLDLLHAQERVRALELEKQRLEDTLSQLEEQQTELQREVRSARARAQRLEDARESLGEQRQLLEEQRRMLREGLHEPQITPCDPSPSEQAPNEAPEGLLEEHERLSEEKRRLQRSQDQERDALAARLAELEAALEEASAQREELLESRRLEVADMQAQIDAMDKQLLSHKKFIEEQAHEREQEREEFAQELAKMQEALKDKEKIQNCEQRLSKEIESLEQQLRMRVEDHGLVQRKRDQLEAEVRTRDDKIHDLRDIIRDLEADLSSKSRSVQELTLRVSGLEEALSEARHREQEALQELEKVTGGALGSQSADMAGRMRQLEEQLEARTQELDKVAQMGSLLQEFRAQVRSLEEKVESRIRQVHDAHGALRQLVQALSPIGGSRDGALSGASEDSSSLSVRPLSADDIRDGLSPSALQWEELRGLEEKVDALVAAVGDTFQENVQLRRTLKATKKDKEELEREKRALQEETKLQMLELSTMKAHAEDYRVGLSPSGRGPVGQQLLELRQDLLREKEAREVTEHQLQLSNEQVASLNSQLEAQRELVARQREQLRPSHHMGTLTRDLEAHRSSSPPQHAQNPVSTRGTMTELRLQQLLELEAAQQKVRTLELEAELEATRTAKQQQDMAELQSRLQEQDEEIDALHHAVEAQVSPLRDKICSLQDDLVAREHTLSELKERLRQDLARAREAHEADVRRLRLRLHEAQQLHAKTQEAFRKEVLALRDTLSRSIPKDEAAAALNKAVSAEREQQQSRHHEEIRLLEETWRGRLEAERQRLEQAQAQRTADLERQCQLHARLRTWNRTDLEKEMASYLEQETAALDARHRSTMDALRQEFDEEKRQLRQAHADEMQRSLEKLRADLTREHTEELARLRKEAEAERAALQENHNKEMQLTRDAWQQTSGRDPGDSSPWTQEEIRSLVNHRIAEEVTRLCKMHEAEVAVLKKAVERQWSGKHGARSSSATGNATAQEETSGSAKEEEVITRLRQEHQAELAHLRTEMSRMLEEKEQLLTVRADQRMLSTEAGFQRERDELSEALRRAQAEAMQRDAAHREQMRRTEATLRAQLETEKGRLSLLQEQLAWRLREEHTQQMQALRTEHLREVEALRDELDRAKLKLRAHKMAAMLRSRGGTPSSDNGSSSSFVSAGTLEESASQDCSLSPALRDLLAKIYREGLHMLSMTEQQLLQRHLTPSSDRSDHTVVASDHSCTLKAVAASAVTDEREQLRALLKEERLSHKKALDELQEQMEQAREQQDQKELKLRAKVDGLECQLRQERSRAEELKHRLDAEQARTLELLTQLNSQRSSCLELEMALANCRADLADANRQILALKQEVLHFKSSLEVEKLHAQNMLNAVNAERAHFNQLQATLELERCRGAMSHEQDLRLIRELKASSSLPSTPRQTQTSDIENMRGGPPSSATRLNSSVRIDEDDAASHSSHYVCAQEKLNLSESLLQAEEEISRLRQLALSQDLLGRPAADGTPSPSMCRLLHKLYWKYRKADSLRKALVYQKQYLLSLLQGFQATEDMAMRLMAGSRRQPPSSPPLHHLDGIATSSEDDARPKHQGFRLHAADSSSGRHFQHLLAYQSRGRQDSVDEVPLPSGSSSHSSADGSSGFASSHPVSARFRFRSAVQALVALHRMQHLVHKWRLAACVPPAPVLLHKVELAVRSVPPGGPWKLGASSGSGFSMATAKSSQTSVLSGSASQASAATVLCRRLPLPPSPRSPARPGPSTPTSGMREFVDRLDNLHKQFGLSDDSHC